MADPKVQKYSEQLKKLGIEHTILEHPPLVKVEDVQKYLGSTLHEAGATIFMKADNQFMAVIRRGDCQLNFKKIKKLFHVSNLRVATEEEFTNLTHQPIGGAHVYYPQIKTLMDKKIFELEYVNAGSGHLNYTFRYKTEDLKKIPAIEIADITELTVRSEQLYKGIKRVFSGIRATGRLHLGNYLGAVKGFLELQKTGEYETVYCVVDVHTITTPYDKSTLPKKKRDIIIDYLAAGLDPEKSIIIYQSDVPEHTELAFYFSSVMSIARMQHLPTFKEKVKQYPQHTTMALLNYPLLMAADILVYKAGLVPVGIDQEPHLEIAREIARKMNQIYGMDFPEPVRFATKGEYIPSLRGEGKMSKSVEGSFVNLTDDLETIRKKILGVPTDSGTGFIQHDIYISNKSVQGGVHATAPSGGVKTLMIFVELFQGIKKRQEYEKLYTSTGIKYSELKEELSQTIYNDLKPIQTKRKEIEADPKYVDKVIKEGAEKARAMASQTVKEVREKMGLL